mmetsp:Transcript_45908/g.109340  ORF Transcript_45908/g.109340 Transcript_45908/m.109340 type:complete len:227 (-) Transcript_45908:29-709(-)
MARASSTARASRSICIFFHLSSCSFLLCRSSSSLSLLCATRSFRGSAPESCGGLSTFLSSFLSSLRSSSRTGAAEALPGSLASLAAAGGSASSRSRSDEEERGDRAAALAEGDRSLLGDGERLGFGDGDLLGFGDGDQCLREAFLPVPGAETTGFFGSSTTLGLTGRCCRLEVTNPGIGISPVPADFALPRPFVAGAVLLAAYWFILPQRPTCSQAARGAAFLALL